MTSSFEDLKDEHRPDLTSVTDIVRNPTHSPLATIAVALILAAFAYKAVLVSQTYGVAGGVLVLSAAAAAYMVAKQVWKVQNNHIAATLAKRDLTDELETGDADR